MTRTTLFLVAAALVGCKGNSVTLTDDSAAEVPDDSEAPAEPEPDFASYEAQLDWVYDTWGDNYDCTDSTVETGEQVSPDDEDFEALQAACPLCTLFYRSHTDDYEICDSQLLSIYEDDYRGLVLGEGSAQFYRFDKSEDGSFEETLLDNAATWDGWELGFSAEITYYGAPLAVEGTIVYEEL